MMVSKEMILRNTSVIDISKALLRTIYTKKNYYASLSSSEVLERDVIYFRM